MLYYIILYCIIRRHINGVVSNGVVPKSQICELGAQAAPEICIDSCVVPGYFTRQHQKCNRFGFGGIKRPFWHDPVWYDPVCVVPKYIILYYIILYYSTSLRRGTLKGVPNCTNNLFVVPGQTVPKKFNHKKSLISHLRCVPLLPYPFSGTVNYTKYMFIYLCIYIYSIYIYIYIHIYIYIYTKEPVPLTFKWSRSDIEAAERRTDRYKDR